MTLLTDDQIDEQWEDLPHVKLMYGPQESGWAVDLGRDQYRRRHAVIANVPYSDGLSFKDLVEVIEKNGQAAAGQVIRRRYDKKVWVRYDGTEETYRDIWKSVTDKGGALEGVYPGVAVLVFSDAETCIAEILGDVDHDVEEYDPEAADDA